MRDNRMVNASDPEQAKAMQRHLRILLGAYGSIMSGPQLRVVMGFKTASGFRDALNAGRLRLRTFRQPGQRGVFARTTDVATCLVLARAGLDDRMKAARSSW